MSMRSLAQHTPLAGVCDGDGVGLLTLRNLVTHSKKSMRALQRENNLLSSMAKQRGMTRE